ncbi:MAG: hypothetical protein JW763_00985 [candidate division Zixibacteria bacterium]|nr:hypothetical protein [candidate division Zixibacteria bacterium]
MTYRKLLVIGLMSLTMIALEIVWTRIFSAEFFYTFAFLTLSLAILGLGLGGLSLRLFAFLNKQEYLGVYLALTGLMSLAGPPLVFHLGLDFSTLFGNWIMVGKFVVTIILLSSSFFFGGMALAMLFKQNHQDMPRLYMADLLGAGLGATLAIVVMNWVGTPVATFLCGLPVLLAAILTCRRWLKAVPVVLAAGAVVLTVYSSTLLHNERQERAPIHSVTWDALSKIKIYEYNEDFWGLEIDNVANSPVYRFDGNWDRPDSLRFQVGIPVDYLIRQFDSCVFLSLGSGGGTDVLHALQEGATEIHAVEVNGRINEMMKHGDLAEFSGHIYDDPRVTVVTEDARAYVRRHKNKFDVIYSLSSNTWSALASGAFALAENYLFTTEAFRDYWQSLSDSGFMMMEHQFYMTRIVSEAMAALRAEGVEDINSHFAVYNFPQLRRKAILLSKRPLTDTLRYHAIVDLTPEMQGYIHLLYPPTDSAPDNLYNRIVLDGWETHADTLVIDISPCTDNKPFIAQTGRWANFSWDNLAEVLPYEFMGFPLSKVLIIIILLVVGILIIPLNLLPYFSKQEHLRAVPWLYFFVIGMAFMIVEIVLMQKYTLFIGPSVYTIVAILLALLVGSGIGSRFAAKVSDRVAFLGIVGWLLLDALVFGHITAPLGGLTMVPRIIITVLLILPLGFFMGMPFPKGTLRVGPLIDWGFAVNGVASVLGSTAILLVAFTYGFSVALLLGAVLYLIAYLLMNAKSAW